MRQKRKEIPVRNNPGIYKEFKLDETSQKWKETGRYRSLRRIFENGLSKKEQGIFDNLEDAKSFRSGELEKKSDSSQVHRQPASPATREGVRFDQLVDEWKSFHYLQIEASSSQQYEKMLPHVAYLKNHYVQAITPSVIDGLVKFWVKHCTGNKQRQTFAKELDMLKVIFNYYRKRQNPAYLVPVLDDHYRASDVAKKAKKPVQSLSKDDLGRFFEELKQSSNPLYYPLALTQFCLGLRIGEACGLMWRAIDFKTQVVRIETTVVWDQKTWRAKLKERPKNGRVRLLVMPTLLAKELRALQAETKRTGVDLVFHSQGHPLNRKTIGCAYNRALKRIGLEDYSGTHLMRKTSATQANEETGDFYAVSKLMDHSTPDITLRYVSETGTQKRKVADALNNVLIGMFGEQLDAENRAPVPLCPAPEAGEENESVKSNR